MLGWADTLLCSVTLKCHQLGCVTKCLSTPRIAPNMAQGTPWCQVRERRSCLLCPLRCSAVSWQPQALQSRKGQRVLIEQLRQTRSTCRAHHHRHHHRYQHRRACNNAQHTRMHRGTSASAASTGNAHKLYLNPFYNFILNMCCLC